MTTIQPKAGAPAESRADEQNIVVDPRGETITLNFAYPYEIDLGRIKTAHDLLAWTQHLAGKYWMTTAGLKQFIRKVGEHKNWRVRL